jgi:hypothetical protein
MGISIISPKTASVVQTFHKEVQALENEALSLETVLFAPQIDQLLAQADDLDLRTFALYQKIEQLKTKQALLLKQVDRTETRYTLGLIDSDTKKRIEEVSRFVLVKRTEFIEKVKCRQLQDVAQKLMFEAALFRSSKEQNPEKQQGLRQRWQEMASQQTQVSEEIAKHGLKLSEYNAETYALIPWQLDGVKNTLRSIDEFPKEPIVKLTQLIDLPALEDAATLDSRKAQIDEYLLLLDPKLQSRIDLSISTSLHSKEGEEWGKRHRYDDLEVLKSAFGSALWEHVETNLPKCWGLKSTPAYSSLLKRYAQFATVKAPKPKMTPDRLPPSFSQKLKLNTVKPSSDTVVVTPHLPTVTSSSDTVVVTPHLAEENLMQKLFPNQGPPPVLPELDLSYVSSASIIEKIKHRPFKLCKALYIDAGHETFQQIIYGKERDPSYQAGYTIKKVKEKSELEMIQSKLEAVCELEGVESMAQQIFIRGCLKSLLSAQRNDVEKFVYEFSKDTHKSGEGWGRQHAYDNAAVLLAAVKKTIATL